MIPNLLWESVTDPLGPALDCIAFDFPREPYGSQKQHELDHGCASLR
jgi:hypothetical protein